jgi:hypothetical protein
MLPGNELQIEGAYLINGTMAQVPVLSHEEHWLNELQSLRVEYKYIIK